MESPNNWPMELLRLDPDDIEVSEARRSVDPERVTSLAASMQAIGLQTPISVWVTDDNQHVHLVAGRHRLEAAKLLGWEQISCFVVKLDERQRRMWELSENLHRAELTVLERSESIAEWIRLSEEVSILRQIGAKPGRPEGGRRAAVREIGIPETSARRAEAVSSLLPEAKKEAKALGLDDNQTALLKAASKTTPEGQVESLRRHGDLERVPATISGQVQSLTKAWDAASHEAREMFLEQQNLIKRRKL